MEKRPSFSSDVKLIKQLIKVIKRLQTPAGTVRGSAAVTLSAFTVGKIRPGGFKWQGN